MYIQGIDMLQHVNNKYEYVCTLSVYVQTMYIHVYTNSKRIELVYTLPVH
jgi:hypothetical protein